MYLSRLIPDPRHPSVRRDLADCHQMHRTILAAFGQVVPAAGAGARASFGVLFRVDEERRSPVIYVQSREKPEWSRLPEGYLACEVDRPGGNPAVRPISGLIESLEVGTTLRFRLLANATRKVHPPGPDGKPRENGTRIPIRDEAARLQWLARKGEQAGFQVVSAAVVPARQERPPVADVRTTPGRRSTGRKPHGGNRMQVDLEGVLFDGHLRVCDATLFRQALVQGVGPGKAYGFGLLSLARP